MQRQLRGIWFADFPLPDCRRQLAILRPECPVEIDHEARPSWSIGIDGMQFMPQQEGFFHEHRQTQCAGFIPQLQMTRWRRRNQQRVERFILKQFDVFRIDTCGMQRAGGLFASRKAGIGNRKVSAGQ